MTRTIFQSLKWIPIFSVSGWIVAQARAKREEANMRAVSDAVLQDIGVRRLAWG